MIMADVLKNQQDGVSPSKFERKALLSTIYERFGCDQSDYIN
jgi:hypothetical protein